MAAQRTILLSTVAVCVVGAHSINVAWADGGAGGSGTAGAGVGAGGAPGTGHTGSAGSNGPNTNDGGGGGAAGVVGGAGGLGNGTGSAGGAGGADGVGVSDNPLGSTIAGVAGGNGGSTAIPRVAGGGGGGGAGGFGTIAVGAVNFNEGTIAGGNGGIGGAGGRIGGRVAAGSGGNGGDAGIGFLGASGVAFTNSGTVTGGIGGPGGGTSYGQSNFVSGLGKAGGVGVSLGAASTFTNLGSGSIVGGMAGYSRTGIIQTPAPAGGIGASLGASATEINSGSIRGGDGNFGGSDSLPNGENFLGGAGGGGSVVGAGSTVTNLGSGVITGGTGGLGGHASYSPTYGTGGTGGVGLSLGAGSLLMNSGTIAGGTGGTALYAYGAPYVSGNGGTGGAGVRASRASITNGLNGFIRGGTGGAPGVAGGGPLYGYATTGTGGAGGVGIIGSDLTISNAGTISGGLDSTGTTRALAIVLTGGTNDVGGTGTILGGIDVRGGSFQPALAGSAVGTPLTVTGPLSFASTSTYQIRMTAMAIDSTAVSGTATLSGANVSLVAGSGPYQMKRYTILTATGGVNGTFSTLSTTSNLAFLTPVLAYDATSVFLDITAANPIGTVPNYSTVAVTQNQFAVAGGLTNAGIANGGTGKILTAFNQLTVDQARATLDSVSGEGIAASQEIAHRSSELFTTSLFDQTTFYGSGANGTGNSITLTDPLPSFSAYAPTRNSPIRELADLPSASHQPVMPVAPARTWRAWGAGFGGYETVQGDAAAGSATQTSTIYGGVVGVDYQVTPNYLVGVAVGGSDGSFSVPGRTTSGETTGGHIAIYDLATFGAFYGASSNAFSYDTNRTTRVIAGFGGLASETERGNFDSHEFRSRLEFGRHFDGYGGSVTPFVALEIAELRSNGFNETAISGPGLLGLNVSGQSTASVPSFVGARFQRLTPLGNGMVLSPTLELAYLHEFAPLRAQTGAFVNLPSSTFLVDGAQPGRNAARIKAGGDLALSARASLFANFDGEFSGTSQFYAGHGGVRYLW